MTLAEKGERYARVFRKAGVFLGKGNIARAAEALKQGQTLAQSLGDSAMARRFADEIGRVTGQPPEQAVEKLFSTACPSLLSPPEGEKIEEGSQFLCRALSTTANSCRT